MPRLPTGLRDGDLRAPVRARAGALGLAAAVLLLGATTSLFGCATTDGNHGILGEGREAYDWIGMVGKAPSKARYEFLGNVTGVAPDTDFVSAAEAARADIREKAHRMGADVIRIDEVRLPPPRRARNGQPSTLLTGRAYRQLLPPDPAP